MSDGVTPVRILAWLSRYSMPTTESNLPTLIASSWASSGTSRAKACSSSGRVSSPAPLNRGNSCRREKNMSGAAGTL
jgi:hypothetical protein